MTRKEFTHSKTFEEVSLMAQGVVDIMKNSIIVNNYRSIARNVLEMYKDKELVGPTGHSYLIHPEQFKSQYACYLQTYEAVLLMESTIRTYNPLRNEGCVLMLVRSFHNGNTHLVIPNENGFPKRETFLQILNFHAYDVGRQLNL